jgi:hypothetical protein
MEGSSQGSSEAFTLLGFGGGNEITLGHPTDSEATTGGLVEKRDVTRKATGGSRGVALIAAEVINLSRNIIITGDDFRHIECDPTLTGSISFQGCACNTGISRSKCTIGNSSRVVE